MKCACGVIIYNPCDGDIKNIIYMAKIFEKIFLYCNSSLKEKDVDLLGKLGNVCFLGSGRNDGLSIGCQNLCDTAKNQYFTHIILFDQDSRMAKNDIDMMIDSAKENNLKSRKVAIISPQIVLKGAPQYGIENKEIDWCITSGSLIDLAVFEYGIMFDNNYFIDRVDIDFCKQIKKENFKILQLNSIKLNQDLGVYKKILGKNYYEHSPIRHYYIARNRLYFNKKYNVNVLKTFLQMIKHLGEIILFEKDKKKKISMFFLGIEDYFYKKMESYDSWHLSRR